MPHARLVRLPYTVFLLRENRALRRRCRELLAPLHDWQPTVIPHRYACAACGALSAEPHAVREPCWNGGH